MPDLAPPGWGSGSHYCEQMYNGEMGKAEYVVERWRGVGGTRVVCVLWREIELRYKGGEERPT